MRDAGIGIHDLVRVDSEVPAVDEGRFGPFWAQEDFVAAGGEFEDYSAYVGGEAEEGRERLVADGAGETSMSDCAAGFQRKGLHVFGAVIHDERW